MNADRVLAKLVAPGADGFVQIDDAPDAEGLVDVHIDMTIRVTPDEAAYLRSLAERAAPPDPGLGAKVGSRVTVVARDETADGLTTVTGTLARADSSGVVVDVSGDRAYTYRWRDLRDTFPAAGPDSPPALVELREVTP